MDMWDIFKALDEMAERDKWPWVATDCDTGEIIVFDGDPLKLREGHKYRIRKQPPCSR